MKGRIQGVAITPQNSSDSARQLLAVGSADMFRLADEAYAVGNAVEELKKIATGVIGSNNEDGVAKWLAQNAAASC